MDQRLREAIINFAQGATGLSAVSVRPVGHGFTGETFAIETGKLSLVAKVQAGGTTNLAREADILARSRDSGVPSPKVFGGGQLESLEGAPGILLMEHVQGRSAEEFIQTMSASEFETLTRHIIRALHVLHALRAPNYGMLAIDDSTSYTTWEAWVDASIAERERDLHAVHARGLLTGRIDLCRTVIEGLRYQAPEGPVVCHGDLGMDHVFVSGDMRLTGIIDFGLAQGNDGLLDLAVMNMYEPRFTLTLLTETYFDGMPVPPHTDVRIAAHAMNIGVMHLAVSLRRGDIDMAHAIAASLERMINEVN